MTAAEAVRGFSPRCATLGALTLLALSCGGSAGDSVEAAAPSITSIAPNEGGMGGGTPVVISGANFQNGATVYFNTVQLRSLDVTFDSATSLSVVSPDVGFTGLCGIVGTASVTVVNPDGRWAELPRAFTYWACLPGACLFC